MQFKKETHLFWRDFWPMVVFATEDPVRKTPCTMRDAMIYYLVNENTRKMPNDGGLREMCA
jgi:hypothetical protein